MCIPLVNSHVGQLGLKLYISFRSVCRGSGYGRSGVRWHDLLMRTAGIAGQRSWVRGGEVMESRDLNEHFARGMMSRRSLSREQTYCDFGLTDLYIYTLIVWG